MAELTLEERGAYNSIIDLLYSRAGDVPDDDARVARMIGCHWREWKRLKSRLIVLGRISLEGGKITAKSVQESLREAADFSQDQSRRAAKRWHKVKNTNENNGPAIPAGNASTSTTTPTSTTTESYSEAKASGESSPPGKPRDIKAVLFQEGLAWLKHATGKPEAACRTLLGKWVRDHTEEGVVSVLGSAQREGPIDAVAWIERAFVARGDLPPTGRRPVADWN